MRIYFDTSALVKDFVDEPGSLEVKSFFKEAVLQEEIDFSTSSVTKAEVHAAFSAMRRNRELTQPKYEETLQRFEKRFRVFSIVEVLPSLIHTSGEIARDYKIKGCDAFQVASALIDEADLIVSTDQDLNEAAKANDLRVWNPMREPIPHI
jgi:predicted nucleic acid-binding protein